MCDSDYQTQKWICEYCTYENFPSSLKCTMCKGAKPLLSEDIFRLDSVQNVQSTDDSSLVIGSASLVEAAEHDSSESTIVIASSNATGSSSKVSNESSSQWSCVACTYINSPRSKRCTQCCTIRDIDKLENMEKHFSNLNFQYDDSRSASNVVRETAIKHSPEHLNVSMSQNNASTIEPINLTDGKENPFGKWHCKACTYENWPKSLRCAMCYIKRENITSSSTARDEQSIHKSNLQSPPIIAQSIESGELSANRLPPSTTASSTCDINYSLEMNDTQQQNLLNAVNKKNNLSRSSHYPLTLASNNSTSDINNAELLQERRLRQLRRHADWKWLNACIGVVDNNYSAVDEYLSCGGNPGRSLTASEVALLNRDSIFNVGLTLAHLALQFKRNEILPMILSHISGSGHGIKRGPSYIAPDLATDIMRHFSSVLRIRKGSFNCHYLNEFTTFSLPAEIEELPIAIQEQLYEELLDRDAQSQLEMQPAALNWSLEITVRLGSRLFVLWNGSAGDCLLDSAMQATYGIFDQDNTLRRALSESLQQCDHLFYSRWKEYEMLQGAMLEFTLEESQWEEEWATLLSLARQPGSSLEQLHVFALAHILRRPIIVYGVKLVKSFRGEDIGVVRFEGVYLPLFWDPNFCIKSPIALGYTRGHFSALVPIEPYSRIDGARDISEDVTFLPLMDCDQKLFQIHFLKQNEIGREESLMRQWMDVCATEGGILVAQQKLHKRPLLVAQMLEEWLNHYRRMAQVFHPPFARRPKLPNYSSDGDTDEE